MRINKLTLAIILSATISVVAQEPGMHGQPHGQPQGEESENEVSIRLLNKEALSLEYAGNLEGAIDANKKILELDPKDIFTINTIAGLYGKLGKAEEEIDWA